MILNKYINGLVYFWYMYTDFVKVEKLKAEKARAELMKSKVYAFDLKPARDNDFVYFPIVDKTKAKKYGVIVRRQAIAYTKRTMSLKEILVNMGLKSNQIESITSYDTVGTIAILKITPDLEKYEKAIANALLESNTCLQTIVKKVKEHHGVYRVQSVKWLAGKKSLTTYAKEAGAIFKVKVGEMFFSPRLSFERLRISELIKPKTNVCVFFAGVAPFSILIAKRQPEVNKVLSIELNPKAHKAAIENIKLNKVENKVEAVCADVNKYANKIKDWADYIIMPLPKTSDNFLDAAYTAIKKYKNGKTGLISIYKFVPAEDPYTEIEKELKEFAKSRGSKLKIVSKRQVRDYSSKVVQVVLDIMFHK